MIIKLAGVFIQSLLTELINQENLGDKSNDRLILLCKINKRETDKPRKSDTRTF